MSDYETELAKISRIPVAYAIMTLDYCALTYGVGACTATAAEKCYNTYPTCRAKLAFSKTSKEYKYSSADTRLPYSAGERPYIKSVSHLPTEIKDNLTVSARMTIELYDENDTDVGIDPYLTTRASVQGTYWKKLLARNPNWKGRYIKIFEGFIWKNPVTENVYDSISWVEGISWATGISWSSTYYTYAGDLWACELKQKFVGTIDNITLGKGLVKIEIVDLLKELSKIDIPAKLDRNLATSMSADQLQLTLAGDDVSSLPATGYVRVDDEIIYYGAIDYNTKIISACTRPMFGTVAVTHNTDVKVQLCRYFPPGSGFDHAKEILLTDCALDASYVNATEFNVQRDNDAGDDECDLTALVSEPTNANVLYFELMEMLNCKSWVAEDLQITLRRNFPNAPGRAYTVISDTANLINKPTSVDLNEKSRYSRITLYWDRSAVGKTDEVKDYARMDMAIDAEAETEYEYNEKKEKIIWCRWLRSGYVQEEVMNQFVKNLVSRLLFQFRDAMPIITLNLELKDSAIKTGDYVHLTTDELQDKNGTDLTLAPFQVIRREKKKDNAINMKLLRLPSKRYMIIAPASYDDYDYATATPAQREYGAICDINNLMPNGDDGYRIW